MGKESIEELQSRFAKFSDQRIRVQTQLEEAEKRLLAIQEKAKQEFGTDDVAKLNEMLSTMRKENESRRSEYQKSLDEIDVNLKAVEQEFAETEIED